jgi:hypothetical protein
VLRRVIPRIMIIIGFFGTRSALRVVDLSLVVCETFGDSALANRALGAGQLIVREESSLRSMQERSRIQEAANTMKRAFELSTYGTDVRLEL